MDEGKTLIYLPDNPLELTKLAFNIMGEFEEDLSSMETNFILNSVNGYTPEGMSLGAAVLWHEYENLEMYEISESHGVGYIATKLTQENDYYSSHLQFLNAFVKDNTWDMLNFLLPRCIVNTELMPSEYYVGATTSINGYTEKDFSHSNLIDSIKDYLYYFIRGMNKEAQSGLDGLINKLVWFDEFYKKYLIYVPSKLE